jgi:hypothetical protein
MKTIVLTSAKYSAATNSTRVTYAEETPSGARDGFQEHTLYHDDASTESLRNDEVDAFIEAENAKLIDA